MLRGINVGGKNMIKMPALKESFEADGLEDVITYIQSGNVLFRSTGSGSALVRPIERMFTKTFNHYRRGPWFKTTRRCEPSSRRRRRGLERILAPSCTTSSS